MTNRDAYLVFNLLPSVGPRRVRTLIQIFGSAAAALDARPADLARVEGIGRDLSTAIATWESTIDLAREHRRIAETGCHVLTWDDETYPAGLREIHSPPLVLYVQGQLEPRDRHAIGIVGSRRTSHYGLTATKKLAFQLARAGLTVVSGLARGIDTAAHEAALASGGRTVAVIGSGLGQLYPPENRALAERIADGHGAVVTEFPIDYPPDKQSFPLRNRIVAGWGSGLLVVEAPARSGALITANQAADSGRTVYAVPGPIDRPTSQGTNNLLKNGATLVTDAADILDDLETLFPASDLPNNDPSPKARTLPPDQMAVYDALDESETNIEELIKRTGLTCAVVSTTLLRLQMKHLVKQLPGQYFVKLL
ncbi:DNA-processing protein DprA [soil metagenome]